MHKWLFFILALFPTLTFAQSWQYLAQTPPNTKPKLFAPEIIKEEGRVEFGSTFSRDGTEFYYSVQSNGFADILYMKFDGIKWTKPEVIFDSPTYGLNDPMLSPDQQRLFFISQMPNTKNDSTQDHDIYFAERIENGWSVPKNIGPPISLPDVSEYYISFTQEGHMYFSSDRDARYHRDFNIYRSALKDGQYQKPEILPEDINTGHYEADVFIAPNESYIIFASSRKGVYGQIDLFIALKDKNGSWGKARNLGPEINTPGPEYCPFVSADGKYLFYTSNQDIYWVSMDAILKN